MQKLDTVLDAAELGEQGEQGVGEDGDGEQDDAEGRITPTAEDSDGNSLSGSRSSLEERPEPEAWAEPDMW